MRTAIQNGFDVNWLLHFDIPENIEQIHKNIRSQGYLRASTYTRKPDYRGEN